MKTPAERTCALRKAGTVLLEIAEFDGLPDDLKQRIEGVLRHYPSEDEIRTAARAIRLANTTLLSLPWLEPDPG